jgi:8-oxo-dGTP pyrophosphatase MutT (NUDIX family)
MKKGSINFNKTYDGSPIFWLAKRINPNKSMYNYYNLPGGYIEKGSSRRQTLITETIEEASVLQNKEEYTFEFVQQFKERKKTRDNGIRIIFVYSSYTDQIPVTPPKEQENMTQWELYTLQQILSIKTIDSFKEFIVRKLQEFPINIKHITIETGTIQTIQKQYLKELCKNYKRNPSILTRIDIYYETKIHKFSRKQLFNFQRKKNDNNSSTIEETPTNDH